MLQSVLFTHTDLDGAGCDVIFRLSQWNKKPTDYKAYHCNYKNIDEKIQKSIDKGEIEPDYTNIYIADIVPSRELLYHLVEKYNNVFLWDHHPSNEDISEKIPTHCCIMVRDMNGVKQCGASLMYKYFQNQAMLNPLDLKTRKFQPGYMAAEHLRIFVDTIRSWDIWEWKETNNPIPQKLNTLLHLYGIDLFVSKFTQAFLINAFRKDSIQLINRNEMIFVNAKLKADRKRIDAVKVSDCEIATLNGYVTALYFVDNLPLTELASNFLARNENIDIFAGINIPLGSVEFRTIKDIDLSVIAKRCGEYWKTKGGGLKQASGAMLPKVFKTNTIQRVKTLIDPEQFADE